MTERDKQTLEVIEQYHKRHGYMPSYREIGDMLGLSSKQSIYTRVHRLYILGLIETDLEFVSPRAFRFKRGENNVGE